MGPRLDPLAARLAGLVIEVLNVARFKRTHGFIWQVYAFKRDELGQGSYVFERNISCAHKRPSGALLVEEWQDSIESEELRDREGR